MAATSTLSKATQAALDRDAVALHEAVADLVRVYQFRDRDRICCHDISVTQCHALETLVEHGPLRLGDLTQRLFLDKSTTSRIVAGMKRHGLVEWSRPEHDRRSMWIVASAQASKPS